VKNKASKKKREMFLDEISNFQIWKNILVANVKHLQFLQRVLNGEANYGRQIVTISSTDGKIIGYARPDYPTVSLLEGFSVEISRDIILDPQSVLIPLFY
jgi:hypothetical protein